jgi:prophage antirepressor-like protein
MSSADFVFRSDTGEHAVRRAGTARDPLFCVKDVCVCLDLSQHTTKQRLLGDDEKVPLLTNTPGGIKKMTFCTESGLYNLILSCRDARQVGSASYRFRRWVTQDVLPSIRRTGQYTVRLAEIKQGAPGPVHGSPDVAVRLAEIKQEELKLRAGLARDLMPLWAAQRELCDPEDARH